MSHENLNYVPGRVRMKVVKGSKTTENQSFTFLNVLLIPFKILVLLYVFLIQLPQQPHRWLGVIRTAFWGYLFWFPDYTEWAKSAFTDESWQLFLSWFIPCFALIMTIISFMVMLGFNQNIRIPESPRNPSLDAYPHIQQTLHHLDYKLSSGSRQDALDYLLGKRN